VAPASPAGGRSAWDEDRAAAHLASLEQFGMRLGLARMRRLLAELSEPQAAYPAIHVVGTNGKSSTVRYAAALLEGAGLSTGAYLSPHLERWSQRIRIGGEDLAPDAFGAAVGRAAQAAARLDAVAAADDRVTQFELLTAAALTAFAEAGIDYAVVEAGLGGRLDATNVLASRVTVLTSVALEHTEHLGGTLALIAREKLAVLRPGTTLVTGPLDDEAETEAEAAAQRAGARRIRVPAPPGTDFRRTNHALARAAVRAAAPQRDWGEAPPDDAALEVAGRLQVIAREPLTIVDGAHNPAGMAALAAALPALTEGRRPVVGLVSALADKDVAAMFAALEPLLDRLVLTRSTNPRALAPATLGVGAALRPVVSSNPWRRWLAHARWPVRQARWWPRARSTSSPISSQREGRAR
jgi:dihydrofolate synthase/folylpolyglutamate synthase